MRVCVLVHVGFINIVIVLFFFVPRPVQQTPKWLECRILVRIFYHGVKTWHKDTGE